MMNKRFKNKSIALLTGLSLIITSARLADVVIEANAISHRVDDFVSKDLTADLGTQENPFTIMEIVSDESMGYYGYYFDGQEPVELEKVGYAYNMYNGSGLGQFINGKVFEFMSESPIGVPLGNQWVKDGTCIRWGYAVDMTENACGLLDTVVVDNSNRDSYGCPNYIEEGYYKKLDEGDINEGKFGHYRLVNGKFEPVEENFVYWGGSLPDGNAGGRSLDRNPKYTGEEASGLYEWVQTGFYISNNYNYGSNWLRNQAITDGIEGAKNSTTGYWFDDVLGLRTVSENGIDDELTGGVTNEPPLPSEDMENPSDSQEEIDNPENPGDNGEAETPANDSENSESPVNNQGEPTAKIPSISVAYKWVYQVGSAAETPVNPDVTDPSVTPAEGENQDDSEGSSETITDGDNSPAEGSENPDGEAAEGEEAAEDEETTEGEEAEDEIAEEDEISATLDATLGSSYKYYATVADNVTSDGSGNRVSTPNAGLKINEVCTETDPDIFYTLRFESRVATYKYWYIRNTNAMVERLFEDENIDDVHVQVITVTAKELQEAVSGKNFTPEGQKYKNLIDTAELIAMGGDFAIDEMAIHNLYMRSHPDYEEPANPKQVLSSRYKDSSGVYVNDIPGTVVYEIFLRQANALGIDDLRPAAVTIDNLNSMILGDIGSDYKEVYNYHKLYPLLMEYSAYYLYANHSEDIWLDDDGQLWAEPESNQSNPGPRVAWRKQMFEDYSPEVNTRAYGGGEIINGNVFSFSGAGVFDSKYNTGAAVTPNEKTAELFNSDLIDDKYKQNEWGGQGASALTVLQYILGVNTNYKDHLNILELQADDGQFVSGYKPSDRVAEYKSFYPVKAEAKSGSATINEEEFYTGYLSFILPWFTGTSKKDKKFSDDFTIKRMTISQFNASTEDISGRYDIILMGSGLSGNFAEDFTAKKATELNSYKTMGAMIFDNGNTPAYNGGNIRANNGTKIYTYAEKAKNLNVYAANVKTVEPYFRYTDFRDNGGSFKIQALTYAIAEYKCYVGMLDQPDVYEPIMDGDILGGEVRNGSILNYKFKLKGKKDAKYGVRLYIDRDGKETATGLYHAADNVFDGTIKYRQALANAGMSASEINAVGSEAVAVSVAGELKDGALVRNKTYTVTCDLSGLKISGYLPWKLEVYNIDNEDMRATVTADTCVAGTRTEIKVLQMTPNDAMTDETEGNYTDFSDVSTSNGSRFKKFADSVRDNGDYDIQIEYMSNKAWTSAYKNNADAWAARLMDYDVVVLGFAKDTKFKKDFYEGLENYLNAGKALVISYGYLESVSDSDVRKISGLSTSKVTANNNDTPSIFIANRGRISNYPFALPNEIKLSNTHSQEYQLNEEIVTETVDGKNLAIGETVLTYNIAPTGAVALGVGNGDGKNLYYAHNLDNVTYLGMGLTGHKESADPNNDVNAMSDNEIKLFINTLVAAYRKTPDAPYLVVTNLDFYPNNVKNPVSTGYLELTGEASSEDAAVTVGLKAKCDTPSEAPGTAYEVEFVKPANNADGTTPKYSVSTFKSGVAPTGGTSGTVGLDTEFTFDAAATDIKAGKGIYYIRLNSTYVRKGKEVTSNYTQKVQILPMGMFNLN